MQSLIANGSLPEQAEEGNKETCYSRSILTVAI